MTRLDTEQVIELATDLHGDQKYGGEYYSYHLHHVFSTYVHLFGYFLDDTHQAIYLHDTLEDCNIDSMYLLRKGVDPAVVSIVEVLTKRKGESRVDYIERVMQCEVARKIKAADSFSNLQHSLVSGNDRLIKKYTENLKTLMRGL